MKPPMIAVGVIVALLIGAAFTVFHWTINRVYVDEGESLLLRYKGPLIFGSRETARKGYFAEEGEIGVLEQMRGPGRHFYCPIWWERKIVRDVLVKPGEVAVVRSMLGDDLPTGEYLVDGSLGETEFKGILRNAYGPGRYRVNPYAYEFTVVTTEQTGSSGQVKYSGWVEVPTGYVGVVTNLAANPRLGRAAGIQKDVLPPGLYPINGKEQQVDIIEIGYREATVAITKKRNRDGTLALDEAGEPMIEDVRQGINFPSNDGFPIHMDFTGIWGIMPSAAPSVIRTFGNVAAVEDKVVLPQIESICRNNGSSYAAVELLVGEDRLKFQMETAAALRDVLEEKELTLQHGLVRHIYIPREMREPIQTANIAKELKLTRDQEQETAKEEAKLREAERKVELEAEKIRAETDKQVAQRLAEGRRTVGETKAGTEKLVAAIDREVAELQAQATVVIGEANAMAEQVKQEARAQKFQLAVSAFNSPEAYSRWVFASSLPEEIDLNLLYAGDGTFWTDLDGFMPAMMARQIASED